MQITALCTVLINRCDREFINSVILSTRANFCEQRKNVRIISQHVSFFSCTSSETLLWGRQAEYSSSTTLVREKKEKTNSMSYAENVAVVMLLLSNPHVSQVPSHFACSHSGIVFE